MNTTNQLGETMSDIVIGLGVIQAIGPRTWIAPGGATTSKREVAKRWARYIHQRIIDAAGEDVEK